MTLREGGALGLVRGWGPTLAGYSIQARDALGSAVQFVKGSSAETRHMAAGRRQVWPLRVLQEVRPAAVQALYRRCLC